MTEEDHSTFMISSSNICNLNMNVLAFTVEVTNTIFDSPSNYIDFNVIPFDSVKLFLN